MAQSGVGSGFVRLCIDDSLNIIGDKCRVVLEGQMITSGDNEEIGGSATPNTLVQVKNTRQIEELFGVGSVLSEAIKVAVDCCKVDNVEFFALPRKTDYGTKASYVLNFSQMVSPITQRGTFSLYLGEDRYSVRVSVLEGMTTAQLIAKVAAAIPAAFPFAVTSTATQITLTAKNGGTIGNNLVILYNWDGRDSSIQWSAGNGPSVTKTAGVDAPYVAHNDYESMVGDCCVCCWAILTDQPEWQDEAYRFIESTWDCEKPQCMTIGYTYNVGTVGQILAADTNSKYLVRMAHCAGDGQPGSGDPILPYLKTAAYSAISCCTTVGHPEQSVEGVEFGTMACLQMPAVCSECFSFSDKQELGASGFVTTSAVALGNGMLTRPYIDRDITNNRFDDTGRENLTYQDVVSLRLIRETARKLSEEMRQYQGLALFTRNTSVREGTRGTSPKVMLGKLRAWAKSQIGVLFSEFENIDEQIKVMTEEETMPPCYGDPRRVLVKMVYTPPLRIMDINVNIAPKFRQSCD